MKSSHRFRAEFDDDNLIGVAGLVPALDLAERAGLSDLFGEHLRIDCPNAGLKATSVIGGMLAGADSIDDMDLLRHGAMSKAFGGVRAPSTLGTFLRSFTHGHVQQIDAASRRLLAGLTGTVSGLLASADGTGAGQLAFVDVDDTIKGTYGYGKQAVSYGYSGVKGLNAQIAAVSTPGSAPVIVGTRLRRGAAGSATGARRMLTQAIGAARNAGVSCQVMARADSAYYGWAFIGAAIKAGAWFSVTARQTAAVKEAIAGIDEKSWKTIHYPNAIWENDGAGGGYWVSDAEVAEIEFVAFKSRRKNERVTCRLIVRRVKRLQPLASDGSAQRELFATWRYHPFITNSALDIVTADERHRDHAIIEQVIAEFKAGPLGHLPSGSYAANAAWLALAAISFNIARASAVAAGMRKARWETLRRKIINIPARIAATARTWTLHLPQHWPWERAFNQLHAAATGTSPPAAATT